MGLFEISKDTKWWFLTIPAIHEFSNLHGSVFTLLCIFIGFLIIGLMGWAFSPGGPAWKNGRNKMGRVSIPGPRGLPIFGSLFSLSHGLAHRTLARMASAHAATQLMAFSLGSTPAVVASEPHIAREILTSSHFGNRPIKQSAKQLMFSRAIGFAPSGAYWRMLRRTVSTHLFSPSNIVAHEPWRQLECAAMVNAIITEQAVQGFVVLRKHLQAASLNNIMDIVFGKRYDLEQYDDHDEAKELHEIVREGFELLGAFNWSDHLPWMKYLFDPCHIEERCALLVPRVKKIIKQILKEHQTKNSFKVSHNSDFIHVLLSLRGEEKLDEDDIVAVLWEMIFRGTDTTTLLTEWVMAELVLNPHIQTKLRGEIDNLVRDTGDVTYANIPKLPYLNAVVKETLRLHPPGPLLSWARLSTADVHLSNGMIIPANTTAMVNMWAITHNPIVWDEPLIFKPERFISAEGGVCVDVRGNDLRLAPFGAGIRVCPGKSLGLATVNLWVAKLVRRLIWVEDMAQPIDLSEVLKLSCEMKKPLSTVAIPRAV